MTPRQLDALRASAKFIQEHGYSPTYTELGEILGLHKSGVFRLLKGLERQGFVTLELARQRSLRIIKQPDKSCPLCGREK